MSDQIRFEELLELYVEDDLSQEELGEFEALLEANPDWRDQANEERQLVAMMREMPRPAAPSDLWQRVSEKARELSDLRVIPITKEVAKQNGRNSSGRVTPWFYAAAASLLLVVGVSAVILHDQNGRELAGEISDIAKSESAPVPSELGEMEVALADRLATRSATAPVSEGSERTEGRSSRLEPRSRDYYGVAPNSVPTSEDLPGRSAIESDPVGWEFDVSERPLDENATLSSEVQSLFDGQANEEPGMIARLAPERGPESPVKLGYATSRDAFGRVDENLSGRYFFAMTDVDEDGDLDLWELEGILSPNFSKNIASNQNEFADFDSFYEWMKTQGAEFLFYTSDERLAFERKEEGKIIAMLERKKAESSRQLRNDDSTPMKPLAQSSASTATEKSIGTRTQATGEVKLTPTATARRESLAEGFTGYLVYHLDSHEDAENLLERLGEISGTGLENLDRENAQIVDQPEGARLLIPYRMIHPKVD